jgi:catechol 2,3-dioxygenase-like lactoylglutathione lyase family enzyme
MIRHIGLNINNESELKDFYEDILGFTIAESFSVQKERCMEIFEVEKETKVRRLEKFGLELEVFITDYENKHNFGHICLEYWKVQDIFDKAIAAGYKTVSFLKENGRKAYFIRDKAMNLFEIKEINHI